MPKKAANPLTQASDAAVAADEKEHELPEAELGPDEGDPDLEEDEDEGDEDDDDWDEADELAEDEPEDSALPTAGDVDSIIGSTEYIDLPNGMGVLCQITATNGFHVCDVSYNVGESATINAAACSSAYDRAFRKLHQFEAYAAIDRKFREGNTP